MRKPSRTNSVSCYGKLDRLGSNRLGDRLIDLVRRIQRQAVMIVAADDREAVIKELSALRANLSGLTSVAYSASIPSGFEVAGYHDTFFEQGGRIREHFGFSDAITNPLILANWTGEVPPVLVAVSEEVAARGRAWVQGRLVLPPSSVLLGYSDNSVTRQPSWSKNGSFSIIRRYRQFVGRFHRFIRSNYEAASGKALAVGDIPLAEKLSSRLVGRWPDGTPTMVEEYRSSQTNLEIFNDFLFSGGPGTIVDNDGAAHNVLIFDAREGLRCPFSAHIRAVNPRSRDDLSDRPALVRRSLPYGVPSASTFLEPKDDDVDRGLHFVCYTNSIYSEFCLLQQRLNYGGATSAPAGNDKILVDALIGSRIVDGLTPAVMLPLLDSGGLELPVTITASGEASRFTEVTGSLFSFCPSLTTLRAIAKGPL